MQEVYSDFDRNRPPIIRHASVNRHTGRDADTPARTYPDNMERALR